MDTAGLERALGAIATPFRLARRYPPTHPAVVESMHQVTAALPGLAELGPVEWRITATGLQWQGQQLLAGDAQVAELAGLLYARGIRGMHVDPGLSGDHVLALFGVALGMLPPDDARLGSFTLTVGGRSSQRPAADRGSVGAGPVEPNVERRAPVALKLDQLPADVETRRAVAALSPGVSPEQQRAAVDKLIELAPALVAQRDVVSVAEAIAGLDRLLAMTQEPALLEAIDRAASALTDPAIVQRMVARLGEPRVPPDERESLVAAVGALAAVSVPLVIDAFLATPVDLRTPYRAAMRRAGDRAMEPLQGRLADRNPEIAAVAAEVMGLPRGHQTVGLLRPPLRPPPGVGRGAGVGGVGGAGGGGGPPAGGGPPQK